MHFAFVYLDTIINATVQDLGDNLTLYLQNCCTQAVYWVCKNYCGDVAELASLPDQLRACGLGTKVVVNL